MGAVFGCCCRPLVGALVTPLPPSRGVVGEIFFFCRIVVYCCGIGVCVAESSSTVGKRAILQSLAAGLTVEKACQSAGKSLKSYEYYRRTDKDFAAKADRIRQGVRGEFVADSDVLNISFAEFRERFLKSKTFPHQQNLVDVVEGRVPGWLHPAMRFEAGQANRVLVNIPPNHAKSMTLTIDYATFQICRNPNFRILIVSQTQRLAADFLYAIKQRLTHPAYEELQDAYAAGVGFKTSSASWTANRVTFGDELRESGEKDPNLEAVGIGGQIYGKRADMIIVDDAVTLANANDFERQIKWLNQDVRSRLNPTGKLIIVGTRVASVDLYRELRNPDRYPGGVVPWTYLAMPALLEPDQDPLKWVTLWPESDQPFDGQPESDQDPVSGLWQRWSGKYLANERQQMDTSTWALVYQQQDVSDDAVFDQVCVRGSVDRNRFPGPFVPSSPGWPRDIGQLSIVCGLDPAIVGDTAAIAYAVDRKSHKRFILDAVKITSPSPAQIRELIFEWTSKFGPSEWVVEKNAFQQFLTQDEGIRQFLASRGVILREHHTGSNKWDAGFGVASMSSLFGGKQADGKHHRDNLIHLPSDNSEMVKALMEQLVTWSPTTKGKTDMVMALWFCEIRAREWLAFGQYNKHHLSNPFLSRAERGKRQVVNIDEVIANENKIFV